MKRTLNLTREPIAALTQDDLANVAGAVPALTPDCTIKTYPVAQCLSWNPGCSTFCTE